MAFDTAAEMWKGLSDLPIAALAVLFGFLLRRRGAREWSTLMFLVALSAVFGATVHTFLIEDTLLRLLWTVLYVFLFALLRVFAHRIVNYLSGKEERERPLVRIAEAVLYLTAVVLLFTTTVDIYALVAFAALLMLRIVMSFIRCGKPPLLMKILLIFLFAAFLFQALAAIIPYGVVLTHVMIMAALVVVYRMGVGQTTKE